MPPEAVLASDVAVRALPARSTWRDVFDRRLGLAHSAASALRQSREVFAQSLAGLPMAVVVCDARLHVFLANDAARHLLGAGEAPLPQRLAALQAAGTAANATAAGAHWRDAIARVLVEGNAVSHPLHDASGRSWLVSIAPYARVGATTVGAIVTLMDVTELQRLQREERDFLQFLSHDLRAPPHAVLSLVDLALAGQPAEPMPGLLARIARHAERSLALLDALLMQQRADRIDPQEFRHHDLAQLLHEVADQLWPRLQAQGQQLVLTGVDQPAWVRGRGELLLRALSNLSINASNYSGRGSRIELSLRRVGEHWLCAVSDNGPGIATEHLPRLFERHFRAPPPPGVDAIGGSGLGLAFVKTVALRHAGRIDVRSLNGHGTTFTLSLPACDDDDADGADTDAGADGSATLSS
jgi:signal transduction histidine kinase